MKFPLKLKGAAARPTILHGSEALCGKESKIRSLQRTERYMMRAMCGVQLKGRKKRLDIDVGFE